MHPSCASMMGISGRVARKGGRRADRIGVPPADSPRRQPTIAQQADRAGVDPRTTRDDIVWSPITPGEGNELGRSSIDVHRVRQPTTSRDVPGSCLLPHMIGRRQARSRHDHREPRP